MSFKILQKLLKTIHEWSIIMSHHFTVPLWVDIYYFCIFKLQIILLETCFHINLCVWDVERELEVSFGFAWEVQDVFPATENDPACAQKVLDLCGGQVLEVPMRWSEDFGHYLNHVTGAFFGIGAGIDHPPLHTENYEYPDDLLEPTVQVFLELLEA